MFERKRFNFLVVVFIQVLCLFMHFLISVVSRKRPIRSFPRRHPARILIHDLDMGSYNRSVKWKTCNLHNRVLLEKVWHSQKRFAKINSQFLWSLRSLLPPVFEKRKWVTFVKSTVIPAMKLIFFRIGTICFPFRSLISFFHFRMLCVANFFVSCLSFTPGLLPVLFSKMCTKPGCHFEKMLIGQNFTLRVGECICLDRSTNFQSFDSLFLLVEFLETFIILNFVRRATLERESIMKKHG